MGSKSYQSQLELFTPNWLKFQSIVGSTMGCTGLMTAQAKTGTKATFLCLLAMPSFLLRKANHENHLFSSVFKNN